MWLKNRRHGKKSSRQNVKSPCLVAVIVDVVHEGGVDGLQAAKYKNRGKLIQLQSLSLGLALYFSSVL